MNINKFSDTVKPSVGQTSGPASDKSMGASTSAVGTNIPSIPNVPSIDKVALSSSGAAILSGAKPAPTFDEEKVNRLRQAITDGSYKINTDAIASKLIDENLALLLKPENQP
jgi:negative regulator of flagellin synthesis FlgM